MWWGGHFIGTINFGLGDLTAQEQSFLVKLSP